MARIYERKCSRSHTQCEIVTKDEMEEKKMNEINIFEVKQVRDVKAMPKDNGAYYEK